MNDQILLDNYLLILKSTVEVYVHGTQESSNEDIRNLFKESLNDILEIATLSPYFLVTFFISIINAS